MVRTSDVKNNKNQPEVIFRKDKEWSLIDSELCLVKNFVPLMGSTVKDGVVISPNVNTPYASVTIKCKKIKEKITGFITHKIDFMNLWHVFKEIGLNEKKQEVLIYWTTKHYNNKIENNFCFLLNFIRCHSFTKNICYAFPKRNL